MGPFILSPSTIISKIISPTSTGVDLKLAVNVALVHKGVENVKDTVDIPDLRVIPQELNLLLRLFGRFTAVLTEGLELERKESNSHYCTDSI